jgi:hypothetical protein
MPRLITGQNAPAKIAVNPLIENAAEQVASASAATSVAAVTVTGKCGTCSAFGAALTVTVGVTLGVTVAAALGVTVVRRLRRLARWRR